MAPGKNSSERERNSDTSDRDMLSNETEKDTSKVSHNIEEGEEDYDEELNDDELNDDDFDVDEDDAEEDDEK